MSGVCIARLVRVWNARKKWLSRGKRTKVVVTGICGSDDVLELSMAWKMIIINRGDDVAGHCGFWPGSVGKG